MTPEQESEFMCGDDYKDSDYRVYFIQPDVAVHIKGWRGWKQLRESGGILPAQMHLLMPIWLTEDYKL